MASIKVLIVDDHPVIRKGVRDLLAKAPEIEIVGETGSGSEALQMIRQMNPDVLILDMQIHDMSGIQVAQILQKEKLNVRVLAFSAHNDREYIQELLENGAAGYLNKDEAPEFILAAVRGIARGEQGWISRKAIVQLSNLQNEQATSTSNMTRREKQVLKQVVAGKTNREIGLLLSISEKTVEKHLETIFRKLDVTSRTEAAVWAVREELLD